MDQAKAIINLNEGVIQLEGPVEFRPALPRAICTGHEGRLSPSASSR